MNAADRPSDRQQAWSVRSYRNGDEEGILQLTELAFKWNDKNYWNWRYRYNPAGVGRIWVADDAGRIAGHYAMIPVKLKIGAETVTVCLSLDIVVHPAYRHQGIFETLARRTYAEAGKEGVHIVYVFPNKFSHPGFITKLGWFEVSPLKVFIRVLNLESTLKGCVGNRFVRKSLANMGGLLINSLYRTRKPAEARGLTITRISSFDARFDDFWREVSADYDIMVIRNKEYLNWRYAEEPHLADIADTDPVIYVAENDGRVCGYTVLKCITGPRGLFIGCIYDLIAASSQEEVIHLLIAKAIEYFQGERVDLVFCRMLANRTYYRALKDNGFISPPFIGCIPLCVCSSHPWISKEYLKNPKHWFIQIGDSDF